MLVAWQHGGAVGWVGVTDLVAYSQQRSECEPQVKRCNFNGLFLERSKQISSLSQADIDATTVNSFKHRLEMGRKCQMGFFKD